MISKWTLKATLLLGWAVSCTSPTAGSPPLSPELADTPAVALCGAAEMAAIVECAQSYCLESNGDLMGGCLDDCDVETTDSCAICLDTHDMEGLDSLAEVSRGCESLYEKLDDDDPLATKVERTNTRLGESNIFSNTAFIGAGAVATAEPPSHEFLLAKTELILRERFETLEWESFPNVAMETDEITVLGERTDEVLWETADEISEALNLAPENDSDRSDWRWTMTHLMEWLDADFEGDTTVFQSAATMDRDGEEHRASLTLFWHRPTQRYVYVFVRRYQG